MKALKKISIGLIISLATFACVEEYCFSFLDHSLYSIESTTNESKSDNAISSDKDLSEMDVTLAQGIYGFNLKHLSGEKVTISDPLFPQNINSCIWQPPKVS